MKDGPDIARVAALIGDPARANMLVALMDGGALTATELATESGITKQTASAHLARLREGGLVAVTAQGRHRYFTLPDSDVAAMLEAIMGVAAGRGLTRLRPGPREPALRKARICYDHLAGELGVALYASLTSRGWIVPGEDGPLPTEPAAAPLSALGIDLAGLRAGRRVICRECLDWSVRKPHLAGALGAALLDSILARGWAKRVEGTRVIAFSTRGEAAFRKTLLAA